MPNSRMGSPEKDLAVFPVCFIHFRENVLFEHLKLPVPGPFLERTQAPGQRGHQYEDKQDHGLGMDDIPFYRSPNIGVADQSVNPECPASVLILSYGRFFEEIALS